MSSRIILIVLFCHTLIVSQASPLTVQHGQVQTGKVAEADIKPIENVALTQELPSDGIRSNPLVKRQSYVEGSLDQEVQFFEQDDKSSPVVMGSHKYQDDGGNAVAAPADDDATSARSKLWLLPILVAILFLMQIVQGVLCYGAGKAYAGGAKTQAQADSTAPKTSLLGIRVEPGTRVVMMDLGDQP